MYDSNNVLEYAWILQCSNIFHNFQTTERTHVPRRPCFTFQAIWSIFSLVLKVCVQVLILTCQFWKVKCQNMETQIFSTDAILVQPQFQDDIGFANLWPGEYWSITLVYVHCLTCQWYQRILITQEQRMHAKTVFYKRLTNVNRWHRIHTWQKRKSKWRENTVQRVGESRSIRQCPYRTTFLRPWSISSTFCGQFVYL